MGERVARQIEVLAADVAHDDADVADRDLDERDRFDLDEPGVQVPRAGQQHVFLQSAAAAGVDECLTALEAVVARHDRPCKVARRYRAAVQHRQNAHPIGRHLVDAEVGRRHVVQTRRIGLDDLEERGVDAVRAGREKRQLTAALAVIAQERLGVLEVVALDLTGKHALRRDRLAVGGDDERDFTRLDDDDRHLRHLVAPPPETKVPAGRQQARLIAGLALEGDDPSRAERRPEALDHETGLILLDHPRAQQHHDERREGDRGTRNPDQPRERQHGRSPFATLRTTGRRRTTGCSG